MEEIIQTTRLDLVSMTPAFLEASLAGDREREEALLGVAIPPEWPDQTDWVRRRMEELQAERALQPWLSRAIVLRHEGRMIGHAGFHRSPGKTSWGALAPPAVELGYTVFERDRRRGYAREACAGLIEWAHRLHGVTRFVVSIDPTNIASLALARRLGFARIGSHIDEEDGPEDIFERRFDADR